MLDEALAEKLHALELRALEVERDKAREDSRRCEKWSHARIDALEAVLRAYETWEADVILTDASWPPDAVMVLTQRQYDGLMACQTQRVAALAPEGARVAVEEAEPHVRS